MLCGRQRPMWKPYLFIFTILCPKFAVPQSDSTLFEYYPLQIGNRWEYENKFEDFQNDTTTFSYFTVEVIGDTMMLNQKRYQILLKKSLPDTIAQEYFYERIDSTSLNIYRYDIDDDLHDREEFFIDSLRLIITGGEFMGVSRYHNIPFTLISYRGSSEDTVLNHPTTLQNFHANDIVLVFGFEYWFAKGLGLFQGLLRETLWRNPITLIYAEINGQSFGNPVSVRQPTVENIDFRLYQNFPNPFNPSTTIQYELSVSADVQLSLYNFLGQKVKTIFEGFQTAGLHRIEFQARDLSSGVYIYEIKSGRLIEQKKLLLLR